MFKKMRFEVNSPEHSAQIQKALFSMGYKWSSRGTTVQFCDRKYLFTDEDGYILHAISWFYSFDDKTYALCKIEVVENYRIVEEEPEVELVELNGRKYRKEDLEKALDALTPVE